MTFAAISNKGGREINEDAFSVAQNGDSFLFTLCDGLGGHGRGEVASAFVSDMMKQQFETGEADTPFFLERILEQAQEKLMEKQRELRAANEMKTTAAVLRLSPKTVRIAHVGDSRVYVFRKKRVHWRTLDHSIPQLLTLTGEIKEKEIRFHPDRNVLLRVMGIEWEEPKYEIQEFASKPDYSVFLLCSDGFWEYVDEKSMCRLLKKAKTAEEWLESMTEIVRKAEESREKDNYTAVAIWR